MDMVYVFQECSAIIRPVFVVSFFNRLMYVGSFTSILALNYSTLFNKYCYNLCLNILLLLSWCTLVFSTRYSLSIPNFFFLDWDGV